MEIKNGDPTRHESADPCCTKHVEGLARVFHAYVQEAVPIILRLADPEGESKKDVVAELLSLAEEVQKETEVVFSESCSPDKGKFSRQSVYGQAAEDAQEVTVCIACGCRFIDEPRHVHQMIFENLFD